MAERVPILMKKKWYPQPHSIRGSFSFEFDDGTLDSTIVPLAFYDEGLGAPSTIETHPENAAFAVINDQANCFVDSSINIVNAEFRFSLNSNFMDDNLVTLRFATMPIHMAFINDYTAIDELTSIEVQDVIEMQTETTDRQGGPLYVAATDLSEKFAGSSNQGANQPFLDTDTGLEAVAFSEGVYYNALQFLTIKDKMRKVTSGLQWHQLTRQRPFLKYRVRIRPNVKRMNPFTFFGLLVHAVVVGSTEQPHTLTRDLVAATQYMDVDYEIRYNEWNQEFNMSKV